MGQTANGAPWPESTAPVRDGSAAIRALAEWVDPRAYLRYMANSGGYTTNSNGGISIPTPFQNVVVGVATPQISAYGYSWNRASSGAPPGVVWFNFVDVRLAAVVPNVFAIIDYIVMGY